MLMEDIKSNTMEFWHGGNLDAEMSFRSGRWEYGPGLYLTTHYLTAKKYAKGSRKFYKISVENGNDSNSTLISFSVAEAFVDRYCAKSKANEIVKYLFKNSNEDGMVIADRLITLCINYDALKASGAAALRTFLVENGVDYTMVDSPFGWNEKMMVLYNMKKIVNKQIIKSTHKIEVYDLH